MTKTGTVREKFQQQRSELQGLILERSEEILSLQLGLLARKHVFLVGAAGTAKSLGIRLLLYPIEGSVYWEHQFGKYSTPEDVFGPPSLKDLKEGSWKRVSKGHLQEATHGLADEIFKANQGIRNTLLKIMNERLYEEDGQNREVPLEILVGASNELPSDEGDQAFYDRFLLRHKVQYIAEPAHFIQMLEGPKRFKDFAARVNVRMTLDEVHGAQQEAQQVSVPRPVLEGMNAIRLQLVAQGIQPSDRRWNEALEVVKAKAWLQGRTEAMLDDLGLLCHICWSDPQHRSLVQGVVLSVANPLLKKAEEAHDAVQKSFADMQKVDNTKVKERTGAAVEAMGKANEGLKRLNAIRAEFAKNAMDTSRVDEFIASAKRIGRLIRQEELGMDLDEGA